MTYSIVARDPSTGGLGVAVQSHFFAVGSLCPWVEPGVGAVATQSMVEVSYGPRGLDRLRAGERPGAVLDALLEADDGARFRQVAIVNANGEAVAHTGESCIAEAGHLTGVGWSVQANMMRHSGVPEAMADAFRAADGDLASRLLAALDAAEHAGGDIRGRQSACLLVAPAEGEPWTRTYSVRVDDHVDPLGELRRLVELHRAYLEGEPANTELAFWKGVLLAVEGRTDEARELVGRAFAEHDGWRELLRRLPATGMYDQAVVDALVD